MYCSLKFSFGIQRRGRLLLADEMGLGKSIQALGIARFFKSDWPLLIVCPSSVKYIWVEVRPSWSFFNKCFLLFE